MASEDGREGKIRDLLEKFDIPFKQNRTSFILKCPKCSKAQKLYIYKASGRFICFKCGQDFSGAVEFVFREFTQQSIVELRHYFYGATEVSGELHLNLNLLDWFDTPEEAQEVTTPILEVLPSPNFVQLSSKWGAPGRQYLESRGIPLEIAEQYGIMHDPSQNRVIFPVKDGEKWYGWQARACGPTTFIDEETQTVTRIPKALTMGGLKKDRVLMFSDRVKNSKHIVLTEGPIDALHCHLVGGNVCSLGKLISKHQLNIIRNSGIQRLYLGLDPDAVKESRQLIKDLAGDVEIYDLRPPKKYSDLGEMPLDEVFELFKRAPKLDTNSLLLYLKDYND
jgi:hypothetical protein